MLMTIGLVFLGIICIGIICLFIILGMTILNVTYIAHKNEAKAYKIDQIISKIYSFLIIIEFIFCGLEAIIITIALFLGYK